MFLGSNAWMCLYAGFAGLYTAYRIALKERLWEKRF